MQNETLDKLDNVFGQGISGSMEQLLLMLANGIGDSPVVRRCVRRLLVNSARHIVGGYSLGTPEDNAVEMLLRIAQELPL